MLEPDEEIPDDRCGFVLQPAQETDDISKRMIRRQVERTQLATCIRKTWSQGRCIWHADVKAKPVDDLLRSRTSGKECLDGAILNETEWPTNVSFNDCSLIRSQWQDAEVVEAYFKDSVLDAADFSNANLLGTDFSDADLAVVNFCDAELPHARFSGVYAEDAKFLGANLLRTDFKNAMLTGATLADVNLLDADFTDSELHGARFTGSNLTDADLSKSNLRKANLARTRLHNAVFDETDVRGADFQEAALYQVFLENTRIDNSTEFGDKTAYRMRNSEIQLRPEDFGDPNSLQAAAWVNRRLKSLHEENAMTEETRKFHIRKEEAERALDAYEENWGRWSVKTLMRYLTNHGESVKHVLGWWVAVIGLSAFLFPWVGGIKDNTGNVYALSSLSELSSLAGWNEWGLNLYFSIITFSTIGYGDLSPASPLARALVGFESIAGALLLALLVFVLGRRVAR